MSRDLPSLFADPPKAYRPQPFWFLNRDFDEPELRRQIAEMDDKGVGGVVLHCRHGLLVPYMSEAWLNLIGVCIDELQQRGMEAWLYDEDDWPSGTVGGRLTRTHPQFRMRYLRVQEFRVTGGVTFQATLEPDDNELICVQAWACQEFSPPDSLPASETGTARTAVRLVGEPRDITDSYAAGRVQWNAPPGKWLVAVFWECPVAEGVTWDRGYYLDTMNPEAVNAFKQMAYDPYLRFRDHFGSTVRGVFTDEPGLMIHDGFFGTEAMRTSVTDPQRTLPGVILAWTRDFLQRFRELKGYDLKPWLLYLLHEPLSSPGSAPGTPAPPGSEGTQPEADATDRVPTAAQVRCDYYDALTTWYIEAYHANLSGWCDAHGLEYIGHTLEEPLWGAARSQGNQMRVLEHFHRPGLDYLGHGVGTRENPFRILAAKCGSSVAHVQGKLRVMCEAFGGSGHGHTLADRRLDANFMACLGVNMFIPHGFYFSFQGLRKSDWPPTEFYHAPFWPWYKHFADYLARLSVFGATGWHVSDACIVPPMKTVQVDMFAEGQTVREPAAQKLFDQVSDLMLRLHHDFDYVDDSQLARAEVLDGRVKFPDSQETYPLVVLPACRVMSIGAVRFLRRFLGGGGRILALGELPAVCDDPRHQQELEAVVREIFGQVSGGDWRHDPEGGGIALFHPHVSADLQVWLMQAVPQLITPDVIVDDQRRQPVEDILCCHRTDGERHLYLLVNRTKEPLSGTVRLTQMGRLEHWSLETGEAVEMTGTQEEGALCCQVRLAAAEAMLLVVTPEGQPHEAKEPATGAEPSPTTEPTPEPKTVAQIPLAPQWTFDAGGQNVMILDRWDLVVNDRQVGPRHGVGIPGQVNTYSTGFQVSCKPTSLKLVLDDVEQNIPSHVGFLSRRRNLEVIVNGQPAPPLRPSSWQDRYFQETDITDLVVEGLNSVQVVMLSLLEPFQHLDWPAYLVGDFALIGEALAAPPRVIHGPFTEEGYPHFVGIARYSQQVDIPAEYTRGHRLILDPGEVHDCCRVIVNGQEVAVRLWPPFEVDITRAVRPGVNEIVVEVANSLANLYDKDSRISGLRGAARVRVVEN